MSTPRRWARVLRNRRPALPERIALSEPRIEVRLRPHPRARRFTLRMTPEGGALLTLPPGTPEAEARAFLARHTAWLAAARARQPLPVAVAEGVALPVDGVPREIARAARGTTRLEGDRLLLAPRAEAGPALAAFLKRRARARIVPEAEAFAARLGREIAGVTLRDTRSRWGSCSAAGRLNFSWRLAMAPPEVQTYLAAHEAAHLAEMNHSARYWAVLAGLMPDYARPQAWLKREGRSLHRYRFA